MNLQVLAISVLISFPCFAAYDETGFSFSFTETVDEALATGCIRVTMHNPPIYFSDVQTDPFLIELEDKHKDHVKDLCLTIVKNINGTYELTYDIRAKRHASHLNLSGLEMTEKKLVGTIFSTIETRGSIPIYSGNIKTIDELYDDKQGLDLKMGAYIDIINLFSTQSNKLFFDFEVADKQLLKELERNMDAYQKSLSPEELAAFLDDVARLEEEAKVKPVYKQKPTGLRSWFSLDAWRSWWRGE